MTKNEMKAYVTRCIMGQGNQVDLEGRLGDVLIELANFFPIANQQEFKDYVSQNIVGQFNQVDIAGGLGDFLISLADFLPNPQAVKDSITACIEGQGNQVDIGGVLAKTLDSLVDLLPDPEDIVVNHYLTLKTADAQENSVKIEPNSESAPELTMYYSFDAQKWYKWDNAKRALSFSAQKPLYICGANDKTAKNANIYNRFTFGNNVGVYCSGSALALLNYSTSEVTLQNYEFVGLFDGCTALVQAPELPSLTLSSGCYQYMFRGCTALVQAPELPATTLVSASYVGMFQNCTALAYIKCLATNPSSAPSSPTLSWLSNVSSTGTFIKASGVTWPTGGSFGIPTDWTVEEV